MKTTTPWITGENNLWLINGDNKLWKQWNIKEINLTKMEIVVTTWMPDGIELNSFPNGSTLQVRCQCAGRRDDYGATDYTRIELLNCSLVECSIIDPVSMYYDVTETVIRAIIKFESFEYENNQN